MKIKATVDKYCYTSKPTDSDAKKMRMRLPQEENYYDIKTIADCVGEQGQAFLPATFKGMASKQENFEQCQLFGIDFDEEPDYEKIKRKFADYHLPIVFSYHTFSSTPEHPKYRIILCHIVQITERWLADMILKMLKKMFPEADSHCFETARLFYGGKGLIDFNDVVAETGENTFNVYNLVMQFEKFLYTNDKKNFSRNIRVFAHKYQIGLSNNRFNIFLYKNPAHPHKEGVPIHPPIKNEEIIGSNIKYKLDIPIISSKIIFYEPNEEEEKSEKYVCKKSRPKRLEKVSYEKMCSCRLWKEFVSGDGNILSHRDKFLLATNILYIVGFEKDFLDALKRNYPDSDRNKWRYNLNWMRDREYKPASCSNCKYCNSCNHRSNIVETLKGKKLITFNGNHDFVSVDESFKQISYELKEALKSKKDQIHLISGQTGIGKTSLYIDAINSRKYKKPLLIAVPTSDLKSELIQRIGKENIFDIPSFDDLPLIGRRFDIQQYYNQGDFEKARQCIIECARDVCEPEELNKFRVYLNPQIYLEQTSSCVIMTHARLLSLPDKILKRFEIIIDEDILYNSILVRVGSIKISTLKKILEKNYLSYAKREMIQDLLALKEKKCCINRDYIPNEIDTRIIKRCKTNDNIAEFLKAGCYMKLDDCIKYLPPIKLPKCKMIILSATLDQTIYEIFFPTRNIIYHEVKQAAYTGNLIQYPAYSMSRTAIKNIVLDENSDYPTLSMLFEKIISHTNNVVYGITFKRYEEALPLGYTLHFGNLTGTDYLSGKNGIIIGTPHFPTYLYELIAYSVGISEKSKNSYKNRQVSYKGYDFIMMSYKNKILQKIQLYLISSELEQAVGRSRLLRTNSTVYVFSNFPCNQATFCNIDYLKDADDPEGNIDNYLINTMFF